MTMLRRAPVLLVASLSCDLLSPGADWTYREPVAVDDGWETASLTEVGLDPAPLSELMTLLHDTTDHRVEGIVIAVHGKLVFEEYFPGVTHPTYGEVPITYDRETRHCLSSVTKSVTATLLGVALHEGMLPGVDTAVLAFFPEMADLNTGGKEAITLRHLVTMSAGLQWDEWSFPIGDPRNDLTQWFNYDGDLLRFVLERPLVATPGQCFQYNGGLTNVLGEVIHRASGVRLDQFAAAHLFAPLGIGDVTWYFLRPDFVYASGDLSLRPRDMVKLGQLYLQGGVWNGERILPAEWVTASASPVFRMTEWSGHVGYSYGWWPKSARYGAGAFGAAGWGGQAIIVLPEFDMVVALTGSSYWAPPLLTAHDMMVRYILPAAEP